ncbi:hypothetical protein ACW5WK_17545 [Aeromonas enteropelogenes]|uniref:hypothetical protein n=1 Tax=Aeromonas enteropelogenes TaxID=29489 RepID=UPI0009E2E88D|nr:hypothetical protein [Aeromonas enteropelogenes]QNF24856.1 hypothetical protein FT673_13115 [Aeromonas hydrophila]UBH54475.1 hypothetical protein LA341_10980 [Aeromonas enteropelogenes]
MLSSKFKTIIRWASIITVSLGYYVWLALASLSFGHISEKESVLLSGPITLEQHRAIMGSVMDATNTVYTAAIWGFLVCVSLILLIFSKVR